MEDERGERTAEAMMRLVREFYRIRLGERGQKPPLFDPSYWALWLLLGGDLPISELGRRLERSKPSMTALVAKLVAERKVRRVRDADDRRVAMLSITETGREYLARRRVLIKESIKKALARLDEGQMDRLCSSLEEVERIFSSVK